MTLLFFDGFEDYTVIADILKRWSTYGTYYTYPFSISSGGRFGGKCIDTIPIQGSYISKVFGPISTKFFIGMAIKRTSSAYTSGNLITLIDSTDYNIGGVYVSSAGTLQWKAVSTPASDISAPVVTPDTWHYLELGFLPGRSNTGSVEIRLNGKTVVLNENFTTVYTTSPLTFIKVTCFGTSSGHIYIDDFYIADSSGTVNNDFLGDVRVTQIRPDGAGNYSQFTPSSGSNYQCVNGADWTGTNYNQSGTTGQIDTFTFNDVSSDLASIKGIQICNGCKRFIESDNSKLKHVIRKNSVDYTSEALEITDNVQGSLKIYETDPEDSSSWTKAKIDASEFGYQSDLP